MQKRFVSRRLAKDKGFSLLELLIAMSVLAVGLLALMSLIMTAVATNSRNRVDTGGTFVAQQFMEAIQNQPGGSEVVITDCTPTSITVATAGGSPGNSVGANLTSDYTAIDFTQSATAITAKYHATYTTCGTGGKMTTYDVRWNVRTIDANSRLVTVAARHDLSNNGKSGGVYYQPPVNLRSVVSTL